MPQQSTLIEPGRRRELEDAPGDTWCKRRRCYSGRKGVSCTTSKKTEGFVGGLRRKDNNIYWVISLGIIIHFV